MVGGGSKEKPHLKLEATSFTNTEIIGANKKGEKKRKVQAEGTHRAGGRRFPIVFSSVPVRDKSSKRGEKSKKGGDIATGGDSKGRVKRILFL